MAAHVLPYILPIEKEAVGGNSLIFFKISIVIFIIVFGLFLLHLYILNSEVLLSSTLEDPFLCMADDQLSTSCCRPYVLA